MAAAIMTRVILQLKCFAILYTTYVPGLSVTSASAYHRVGSVSGKKACQVFIAGPSQMTFYLFCD